MRQDDPFALLLRNFCAVMRKETGPVTSGREGFATLRVIAAIKQAAAIGQMIVLES